MEERRVATVGRAQARPKQQHEAVLKGRIRVIIFIGLLVFSLFPPCLATQFSHLGQVGFQTSDTAAQHILFL